ncbi:RNA-guided endonuclease InsQ/TnpB family protein [Geoglobus acetivorans]|uniref:Transposase, IS605 OrfB family n=1 Tax=Geoglobus acetivorans TaxID=565033 RepID=A0A0A7GI25_GEOAI|nr:transposase, IS605 OrfB family [Geoglobus acetivorans]
MYLTQKNHIRCDRRTYKILRILTRLSKNLYNFTLYTVRQYYFNNGKYLPYEQAYHLVKHNENYQLLPSQVAQQTMKVVDRNMRSFFHVLNERKKGNFNRPVSMPGYLPKDGYFVCIFQKDMFKVIGNKIRLSLGRNFAKEFGIRYLEFKLPSTVVGKKIKEVRILPRYKALWFEIEYVYDVEPERVDLDYGQYLAIDLGLGNFATCISTGGTPFIIEGRGLKSFNRWWNRENAKLQSIYDKQGIKMGRKIAWLLRKRKNVINNFMNQAVSHIVKYCLSNRIGNVVIGELKDIKQNINLGRINNQNFQYIPYGLFKQKLKTKCEYYGINYIEVNEAYTSQTCSVCGDINRNNRKHRGLYVCGECGSVLNADVNGALNILKKVAPESVRIGSSGGVNPPVRIRVASFGNQTPHEALSVRARQFTVTNRKG